MSIDGCCCHEHRVDRASVGILPASKRSGVHACSILQPSGVLVTSNHWQIRLPVVGTKVVEVGTGLHIVNDFHDWRFQLTVKAKIVIKSCCTTASAQLQK